MCRRQSITQLTQTDQITPEQTRPTGDKVRLEGDCSIGPEHEYHRRKVLHVFQRTHDPSLYRVLVRVE